MPDDDLEDLAAFQRRMDAMPARRLELIRACRDRGRTWPAIAAALSMTVQGARKAARA